MTEKLTEVSDSFSIALICPVWVDTPVLQTLDVAAIRHAVRLRSHLTGQDISLGRLFVGQSVFDVAAALILPRLAKALARAAGAVATIQGNIDPDAIGCVCDGIARSALDETGDSVLEVQRDLVAHGS